MLKVEYTNEIVNISAYYAKIPLIVFHLKVETIKVIWKHLVKVNNCFPNGSRAIIIHKIMFKNIKIYRYSIFLLTEKPKNCF